MPYEIDNDHPGCIGFAVVNMADGELEGCHRTEAQAAAQLEALNITEAQSRAAGGDPIVTTDIDGTIIDNNGDPMTTTINAINDTGLDVYVLTGRPENRRGETITQLNQIGIDPEELLMVGSQDAKQEAMKTLLTEYDVTVAYENDPQVIAGYRKLGVTVKEPSTRATEKVFYTRRQEVEKILADLRSIR